MEKFGLCCDEFLNSEFKNKECCYPYHLMNNCTHYVRKRTSHNKSNDYCTKHKIQSEYLIPVSPVDELIGKNRKKMEIEKNQSSVKKEIIEQQKQPNFDDINVGEGGFLKSEVVLTVDKNPIVITPMCGKSKINWSECYPEKRRSRRLGNLPPEFIIKTEDEKVNTLYDNKSLLLNNQKIKKEKQLKSEIIDNTNSNIQDDFNQPLPDDILNEKQNSKPKNIFKSEPIDDEFDEDIIIENTIFAEIESLSSLSDENNASYDEETLLLRKNRAMKLINKVIIGDNSSDSDESFNQHGLLKKDTQPSLYKAVKPIEGVVFNKDLTGSDVPFGQHEPLSGEHFEITKDKNNTSLNEETWKSPNKSVKPINSVKFDKNPTESNMSFDQHEPLSGKHFKIAKENNNTSLNEETWKSPNKSVEPINSVKFDKNPTESNVSFDQHEPLSEKYFEIIKDKNSISLNEETQESSNTTLETVDGVVYNEDSTSNNVPLGQHGPLSREITPDQNNISLNKKTLQSPNKSVGPINSVTFYEDPIGGNVPYNQNGLLSGAHLKLTDENNIALNQETQQMFKSTENQNTCTNNSFCCVEVREPLNEIGVEVENNDLTKGKGNQINKKTSSDKSFPKLRVVSPTKLFKSPAFAIQFAANTENTLAPNYNDNVTQTPISFENILNPNVTDSEQVNTNNYASIPCINSINDNQNLNVETSLPKIIDCFSYSTSDKITYSEKTNNKKFDHEIHSKVTEEGKVPSLYQTNLNVTDPNYEHTQCQQKQMTGTRDRLSKRLTNSNITKMETRATLLPKNKTYSEMTIIEKKLYKDKYNYFTALGLTPTDKLKNTRNEEKKDTTKCLVPPKTSDNYTERPYYRTSSEKLKRSYFLEYSNNGRTVQKHTAVPVLIPEKTSGGSFHEGRSCSDKCNGCNAKFGLFDTPFHIARIKNPDKQKACLENAPHLVGPKSCLCTTCFRSLEKKSCINYSKSTCIVVSCSRNAIRFIQSSWTMDHVRFLLSKENVILRTLTNQQDTWPFCDIHLDQVKSLIQCQLCGNQVGQKFRMTDEEVNAFQQILNIDEISFELKSDLFLCKTCRLYLLWRIKTKQNPSDQPIVVDKNHQNTVRRICTHQQIDLPSYMKKDTKKNQSNTNVLKEDCHLVTVPTSFHNKVEESISKLVVSLPPTVNSYTQYRPNILQMKTHLEPVPDVLINMMDENSSKLKSDVLPPEVYSDQYIRMKKPFRAVVKNDSTKPTYKEPVFVSVLKPVDNLEFLSTFKPSIFGDNNHQRPMRFTEPPSNIHLRPYQPNFKKNNLPIAKPQIARVNKKKNLIQFRPRYLAHIMRFVSKLFKNVVQPYPSSQELVKHLFNLEKLRRSQKLVYNPNKNTSVSKTNFPSKVNGNSPLEPQNVVKRQMTVSSENQVAKKLKVDNDFTMNERKNFTQESTPKQLSENIIYKPIELRINKNIIISNNKNQITLSKIPNAANAISTAPNKISVLNPKTALSNIVASTSSSAVSQCTVTNATSTIVTSDKAPRHIKLLPIKIITSKKLNHGDEKCTNLNFVKNNITGTGKTVIFAKPLQSSFTKINSINK